MHNHKSGCRVWGVETEVDVKKAILIAAIILIIGLVGQSDYEEELAAQRHYCNMVESGAWPPFNPETNCDMESGK